MIEHNGIVHRMHIHNTQPLPLHAYHPSFQQFIRGLRSNTVKPATTEHTTSLLPLRSRPFYFMPSGPKIVLSSKVLTKLANVNPQHPRVRRHIAACEAIEHFHIEFKPRPENKLSFSWTPVQLKVLCNIYNTNYRVRANYILLIPIQIWRFIYRRSFEIQSRHSLPAPSHQAIYIQMRHSTQDEFLLPSQKRKNLLSPSNWSWLQDIGQ